MGKESRSYAWWHWLRRPTAQPSAPARWSSSALISDDIYLDITFAEWGRMQQGGGAFAYIRSSVVPIPAAAWMFASALGLLGLLKRRLAG